MLNVYVYILGNILGYLAPKEDLSRDHTLQILPTDLDKLKKRKSYGVFLKDKRFENKVNYYKNTLI